jgi:rod shape determining protein RodA
VKIPFVDRRVVDHFDFLLIVLILPIIATSIFLVSEINENLATKQFVYVLIGFMLFAGAFIFPVRNLTWLIPFAYWFSIALLVSVEFFGVTRLGAQRWLEIPLIGITLQPSEIIKPAFILMLGYLIHQRPPPKEGYGWIDFMKISFYILLPFVLIAIQPDLGTALVLLLVGFGVLLAVGLKRRIWMVLITVALAGGGLGHEVLLQDYQKQRIADFISEKPSYHVQQSMIAVGSGGLAGKPKEEATQTQLRFLPIATSDFLFAYHVERFGFLGAVALVVLYVLLVLHLLSLNSKVRGDYLTMVTLTATAILIFIYMSVNIAMTIGFAPVVGLPLPLFSHGGSSFITFMVLFAIIENLLAFRFNFLYTSALNSVD